MPKSVTLRKYRDSTKALTTVTVSTGWGDTIVFNAGTYYPPFHGSESREYDEYVILRAEDIPLLTRRLGVEGTRADDIFASVVSIARARNVVDLKGARQMLHSLGVPFKDDTWISQ
jgi:hypothetical protein